jgi:hypothetical protein
MFVSFSSYVLVFKNTHRPLICCRTARANKGQNAAGRSPSPGQPSQGDRPLSNVDDILDSFATRSIPSYGQPSAQVPYSVPGPTAPLAVRSRQGGPPSPLESQEQYGNSQTGYAVRSHPRLSIQSHAGIVGQFPSFDSFGRGDSTPPKMPSPTNAYFPSSPTRQGFGGGLGESHMPPPSPRRGVALVDSPIRDQPKSILKKPTAQSAQAPGTPSVFLRSESRQSAECLVEGRDSYMGVQTPVRKISLTRGAQPVVMTREESLRRRHDRQDTDESNNTVSSEAYNGIGSMMVHEQSAERSGNSTPTRDGSGRVPFTPTASESEASSEVLNTPPPRLSLAPPAPLAFPRKLVDDNGEFMPLSQMNLQQQQPDYRSPTLSVYDFYGDGGATGDPSRFSQSSPYLR